jgi:hypothetical protein
MRSTATGTICAAVNLIRPTTKARRPGVNGGPMRRESLAEITANRLEQNGILNVDTKIKMEQPDVPRAYAARPP